jgi:uncharacterized membrane protein
MDALESMYFGYALAWAVVAIPVLLLSLAVPYAILRLRDNRSRTPDPQLGFKVAMHYFFSVAILLILFGLTAVVVDLVASDGDPRFDPNPEPFPTEVQRAGFGMILSGAVFAVIHFFCLLTTATNPFTSPVRRTFLGCRLAVHGLIVMTAVTALLIGFFLRDSGGGNHLRRVIFGVLMVWTPSWMVHLVLLRLGPVPVDREREREEGQ